MAACPRTWRESADTNHPIAKRTSSGSLVPDDVRQTDPRTYTQAASGVSVDGPPYSCGIGGRMMDSPFASRDRRRGRHIRIDTRRQMPDRYETLFADHRSNQIAELRPWQQEVLAEYAEADGDVAIELPTGAGKTLVALLAGEEFRQRERRPVAYLAGNKQLAQQVERQANALKFPVVRFQGRKGDWSPGDVFAFNMGQKLGIMNYWNYFNESPGVAPAGMLILDDVHLLEEPLRDFFTLTISRLDPLCDELLGFIVERFPYYLHAADVLKGDAPPQPPEMLVFPDSSELAGRARALLDDHIKSRDDGRWWTWGRIRDSLGVCCWLISPRGITFTPFIPPTQTIDHFKESDRRLYLSATVGTTDDLQRRLGVPPLQKLTASAPPRQGERFVVLQSGVEEMSAGTMVKLVQPLLAVHAKALWLCARQVTSDAIEVALKADWPTRGVRRLRADNAEDEAFSMSAAGHLVTAGRFDGMDFPDDACRIEILPELPIATSDLEEFVSAYLRDAPFAGSRLAQRVAQALGRCNRTASDRAVYVLADPAFAVKLVQPSVFSALPPEVRNDIAAGLMRDNPDFSTAIAQAAEFLSGADLPPVPEDPPSSSTDGGDTARYEVAGMHALWREDYARAAELFDRVAQSLSSTRELRGFWIAMRALALLRLAAYGDVAAQTEARQAVRAAAATVGATTFFSRLRHTLARLSSSEAESPFFEEQDVVFAAWDRLIDRYGSQGARLDDWFDNLLGQLASDTHDVVVEGIANVGLHLLGLDADRPKRKRGATDALWSLGSSGKTLAFEVKLAPKAKEIAIGDVNQAEGAVRALEKLRGTEARILIVTPHAKAETEALDRLERGRLITTDSLAGEVRNLRSLLQRYRYGWSESAEDRGSSRRDIQGELPPIDWLWNVFDISKDWITSDMLAQQRKANTSGRSRRQAR